MTVHPFPSPLAPAAGSQLGDQLEMAASGRHGRPGQLAAVRLLRLTTLITRPALAEHARLQLAVASGFASIFDHRLQIDWLGVTEDRRLRPADRSDGLLLDAATALDEGRGVDLLALGALPSRQRPRVLGAIAAAMGAVEHVEIRPVHNPEFDFMRDVIGDDLIVGGVVYSSSEWTLEDGDVRPLTEQETADRCRIKLADRAHNLADAFSAARDHARVDHSELLSLLDPLLQIRDADPDGTPMPTRAQVRDALFGLRWAVESDGALAHPDRTGRLHPSVAEVAAEYGISSAVAAYAIAHDHPELIALQSQRNAETAAWRQPSLLDAEAPF